LHDYLNRDKAADNATASNQSSQIRGLRNVSDPGWRKFNQRHSARRRDSNRFLCKIKLGWLPPFILARCVSA